MIAPSHPREGRRLTAGADARQGNPHLVGSMIGAALFTDAILKENKFSFKIITL